ncbi:hypothetical protein [Vibrio parahaemolyticus]|uniref:hypothetical protein n=1 Tax=Vibrio parahaemolyticus TaxID=670 RepID=UPI001110F67D|nr:hypothetical protein [Vibrio parahaemolyticus]TMX35055.1 hypothetical protein DA098_21480 [Vibrio parahaemolyticus]TMX78263.1 hypothetical protein DA094_11110 [Vibrio parahaemolyticus]
MKKLILSMIVLSISNITIAQDLDLTKYYNSCVNTYQSFVTANGQSDFNGIYLEYKDDVKINPKLKSYYFNPHFNLNVRVGSNREEIAVKDLEESTYSYSFFDREAKSNGKRYGMKWEFQQRNYDTYELRIYDRTSFKRVDGKYKTNFNKPIDFRLDQEEGEPMEVLVLKRNFNKEEYLEKEYTILKQSCLKQEK